MQETNPREVGESGQRFIPDSDLPPKVEREKAESKLGAGPTADQKLQDELSDLPNHKTSGVEVPVPRPPTRGEIPGDFFDIAGLRGLADKVIKSAKAKTGKLSLAVFQTTSKSTPK